jgi:tRNA dimethylallyltransferase
MPLATTIGRVFSQAVRSTSIMAHKPPIIVVIGNTGAGKSRMAVDVALACNGEVINADAMQIYHGLDIITNKMTNEEMCNVRHHLMGFKDPGDESFVGEWVAKALETVSKSLTYRV